MPRVPTLEPRVQIKTPNIPAPQIARPPEEAFGAGVAAATGKLGEQVTQLNNVLAKQMIEMEKRESEKNALDIQTQFQTELQNTLTNPEADENGTPKGFLNRQLSQANGSAIQFDQISQKIAQKYAGMPVSPDLQNKMNETLKSHLSVAREQVIRHEASQRDAAAKTSLNTYIEQSISSAAGVVDPIDLAPLVDATQANAGSMMARLGYDKATVELSSKNLAGNMVKSAVAGVLETDPTKAKNILERMKDRIFPLTYAELSKTIEGKFIHDQSAAAWNAVSGMRLSDGNIDLASAQRYVDKLPYPQERKDQILSYVHTHASIANTELKQQQEAIKRSYTDQLVTDFGKVPIDVAFARAVETGLPPTMIAELQNEATTLYQNPQQRFDTWLSKQPNAVQGAVESSRQAIEGAYPTTRFGMVSETKVNVRKAAMTELEQQWIGKTPAQIRQITADALSKVVTGKWLWFNTTETSWKMTATNRAAEDMRMGQLEKDNPNLFAKARAKIVRDNAPLVYDNIKAVMDKMAGRGQ